MMEDIMSAKTWVNGAFDVLHIAHIGLLNYAMSLGGDIGAYVHVGINSDEMVREMKGDGRPFNDEYARQYQLVSLASVQKTSVFRSSEELHGQILEFNPDYIVVGEEYKDKEVIGSDIAEVIYYPKIEGYSTTKILNHYLTTK